MTKRVATNKEVVVPRDDQNDGLILLKSAKSEQPPYVQNLLLRL